MADVNARKAAIEKASVQVRTGGISVRRSKADGRLRSKNGIAVASAGHFSAETKASTKKSKQ
jgi:hypothetical protein